MAARLTPTLQTGESHCANNITPDPKSPDRETIQPVLSQICRPLATAKL